MQYDLDRINHNFKQIDFTDLKTIIRTNPAPEAPATGTYKPTCVFLLLFNREAPHILAIQKTESEGYPWSNQVALPGGHLDAEDASPLDGAFRELQEELNISRNQVRLLGSLGHFQTINRRDIEVFAGIWDGTGPVRHDPAEISRILEIPVEVLLRTHIINGYHGRIPAVQELKYPFKDIIVWGATARILHYFIELLHPLVEA